MPCTRQSCAQSLALQVMSPNLPGAIPEHRAGSRVLNIAIVWTLPLAQWTLIQQRTEHEASTLSVRCLYWAGGVYTGSEASILGVRHLH